MSFFKSVVRIITTLKKPAGHFVECRPPAGRKRGLAGDMIYYAKGVSRVYLREAIRAW